MINNKAINKRIEWLDGIKGIACILIFFHHFFLAFYPAIYYGEAGVSHLHGYDVKLAQSPLSVVLNGNFMVALFCIISSMVISMQVMSLEDNKDKLSEIILKRYLRLMLPVLPIGIVVYFMLKYRVFTNLNAVIYTHSIWLSSYYTAAISFKQALKDIFIQIWFYGDSSLSTAFWMLSQLFYGSFLTIILSVISWKANKHIWLIYIAVFFFFFDKQNFMMAFVLGVLLAWIYKNRTHGFQIYIGFICLIAGIFLGGYPSGVTPTNIYWFLRFESYVVWHILGAFLTVYGIWNLNLLHRFMSLRLFHVLGKICYSVYLIHIPVLFSLSTYIFLFFYRQGLAYWESVIISLILSTIAIIELAYLYNKYIERICEVAQKKILNFFIEGNK
ncbi:MAG: acyltransferase [Bacillota bacterium]|nr:acyltransferase [Bacillota bacterium]